MTAAARILLCPHGLAQPCAAFIYSRFLELIMTDSLGVSPCLS